MRIVGLLLAAGSGSRFGGDKLRAAGEDGEAIGARACRSLVEALPDAIAIVRTGDTALSALFASCGVSVVECDDAVLGMGHSLACGVCASADADGWVVALADMPWVRASSFAAIARALRDGASVATATHGGQRGHPVGFRREHADALMALRGDRGGRDIIATAGTGAVAVEVDDPGVLRDVDVPQDLDER